MEPLRNKHSTTSSHTSDYLDTTIIRSSAVALRCTLSTPQSRRLLNIILADCTQYEAYKTQYETTQNQIEAQIQLLKINALDLQSSPNPTLQSPSNQHITQMSNKTPKHRPCHALNQNTPISTLEETRITQHTSPKTHSPQPLSPSTDP